jgi:DNA-binding NtrC family response regulator
MQSVAQFQTQPSSGLTLVEADSPPAVQIVSVSAAWRKLMMQADMAAPHVQVAAIEGEHGTGKQTLARYLFSRSPMAGATFQRRDAREWLVTDADPSTLAGFTYLDRVDLLAPPGQGLLLAVLEAMQDRPPAAPLSSRPRKSRCAKWPVRASCSPISPSASAPSASPFRPLRLRREDIAPLAQSLLERICARYQQRPVLLGPGALARLLQHTWPGNVRELASVLETALLEAVNGVIRAEDLNLPSGQEAPAQAPQPAVNSDNLSLDSIIRHHVEYVLELNRGNKLRAARQLHISRSTLYRILANETILAR